MCMCVCVFVMVLCVVHWEKSNSLIAKKTNKQTQSQARIKYECYVNTVRIIRDVLNFSLYILYMH